MAKKKLKPKVKPFLFLFLFCALICFGVAGTWQYLESPVDKKDKKEIEVKIESGTNSTQIGEILKEKHLIKSTLLFKLHLKMDHVGSLKASTYKFSKSMSLQEIIEALEKGVISNDGAIKITFRDGERIPSYAKIISEKLGVSYDDVVAKMNDKEYLSSLIPNYWFLTDAILQEGIYYPLEGYLAPETYYFEQDATVEDVVQRLLDQTEKNLEDYKDIMKDDPHYYMTMASVVQLEGNNTENRSMIAGIFQNRMDSGMNMGSDVTTYYALQKSMKEDLTADDLATVSPYNTRGANMISKMPIGPICNPEMSSVEAATHPTKSDYYFFVADKYGNIFYTKTNQEHDKKVADLKANGDWIFS
ncbi:MAG: endolytic transglycosylase MltG [Bacilli bacterium]|nr:endolytic transglycosylase MltG [Bacilli bacterium]